MRLSLIVLGLGFFLAFGCATGSTTTTQTPPEVAAAGLVRIASKEPGDLFAHPSRSIDDYDDILLSDVDISYGAEQKPLSEDDVLRVRSMAYSVVMNQVPAAGQLIAIKPGPCTVALGVQLDELQFSGQGAREHGSAQIVLEFADSQSGDPLVRYGQHRELRGGSGMEKGRPDLDLLKSALVTVANGVRLGFRDALPLNQTGTRAGEGCKGRIGEVRKQSKAKAG
jgi:hypothetical protein